MLNAIVRSPTVMIFETYSNVTDAFLNTEYVIYIAVIRSNIDRWITRSLDNCPDSKVNGPIWGRQQWVN